MRHFILLVAFLALGACATTTVAEKASRFDEGVAAYDAGDFETAYRIWNELAREDDLAAMRNVAQLLRQGKGVAKDSKRAFKLYMEAAEKGYVLAMANLGDMYLAGEGVERNPQAAAAWYARAASAGQSIALFKLAEMYDSGNGIPTDKVRARGLLERAARNGYAKAQQKLRDQGLQLNALGDVVAAEPAATQVEPGASAPLARASVGPAPGRPGLLDDLFKSTPPTPAQTATAAGNETVVAVPVAVTPKPAGLSPGDPIAPDLIAKMAQADATAVYAGLAAYNAGDKKNAMSIWHDAATRGVADAQLRVGLLHARGEGTIQDMIEAYRWLRHAATQGHPQAIEELARLSAKLAPAERAIGESLVREPINKAKKPG
jgi:TPR repeat protein